MPETKSQVFTLISTSMIFAPGVVRWVEEAVAPFNEKQAREILSAWEGIPKGAINNIIAGKYTVQGDKVLVSEIEGEEVIT